MIKRYPPLSLQMPRLWLMTDERMGDALLPSIDALPSGSGIIFRHYSLPEADRRHLFKQVQRSARKQGHIVLFAGSPKEARALGAFGAHGQTRGAITAPVHSIRERIAAERNGAQLLFVSPVFPTASHPNGKALGRSRFGRLIKGARVPVIALGGMDEQRARSLNPFNISGWAAIAALSVLP